MQGLVREAEDWIREVHFNSDHLLRTAFWVKQLDSNASDELIVACITHDAERAFPEGRISRKTSDDGSINWADEEYNLWHGKRSAEMVAAFLKEKNAPADFIEKVTKLIEVHEIGGNDEENLIQAADSISFLEVNAPRFIKKIPEKWSKQQVKDKFTYMFERIQIKEAREFAKPFYDKAMKMLEEIK